MITHLAMASSLGADVETSCAAARAGLVNATEIQTLNTLAFEMFDEAPVFGHQVPSAEGFCGLGKILTLGKPVLSNMLASANLNDADLKETPIYLCLADRYHEEAFAIGCIKQ